MKRRADLTHVEGFGVETASGRIGRVKAVIPSRALLVHTGGRSCTLRFVPLEDVARVDRESCRIALKR